MGARLSCWSGSAATGRHSAGRSTTLSRARVDYSVTTDTLREVKHQAKACLDVAQDPAGHGPNPFGEQGPVDRDHL